MCVPLLIFHPALLIVTALWVSISFFIWWLDDTEYVCGTQLVSFPDPFAALDAYCMGSGTRYSVASYNLLFHASEQLHGLDEGEYKLDGQCHGLRFSLLVWNLGQV